MHIRAATVEDAAAVANVHVASWRESYSGLLPADILGNLSIERRQRWWEQILADEAAGEQLLVCEVDEEIVGFCSYGATRDDDANKTVGEIYALYVRSAHWDKGYGYALIKEALIQLKAAGFHSVTLWVLDGNGRAERFYEQVGFRGERKFRLEKLGKKTIREYRYRYNFS